MSIEIEEQVIDLIRQRRDTGRAKYGVTMERQDLSESDWLQHLIEELLDAAIYAMKLKRTAVKYDPFRRPYVEENGERRYLQA